MTRVRQLYLYGISALSLLFLATGVENLIRLLVQTIGGAEATPWLWLNRGSLRQQVSFFAALTIINLPVWIGHWLAANRPGVDPESASIVRRFYLFLVKAGALLFFVPAAINLLRIPIWAVLGAPIGQPIGSAFGAPVGLALVTVPIWVYHRRLALADAALAGEDGGLGTSRRLYYYVASFTLVNFLLINYARLATSAWEGVARLVGKPTFGTWAWVSISLLAFAAAIAVCLTAWWWHWAQCDLVARGSGPVADAERRSLLRRLSLYGLILVCLIVAAVNATTLLNDLFRALLGAPDPTNTGRPIADALGQPIAWALVYGSFWLYQRWWLQREANRAAEARDQAALRQLYYYLVAAVGLSLFAMGLTMLLSTLLSLTETAQSSLAIDWNRDRISSSATLVVVGGPIWLGHWLHQQRLLRIPERAADERSAIWRRIFLYLVLFVTVVAVLVNAASMLYWLFFAALSETGAPSLLEDIRTPISVIAVASVLLWYHWRVLGDDLATRAPVMAPGDAFAAVVFRSTSRENLEEVLAEVARQPNGTVEARILREPRLDKQVADQLRRWRNL